MTLKRGDEMSRFVLDSTVVMLWPNGALQFNPPWLPSTPIRLNELMATGNRSSSAQSHPLGPDAQ